MREHVHSGSSTGRFGAVRSAIVPVALVLIVIGDMLFIDGGIPALRHDWPPFSTNAVFSLTSTTGWNPIGLGSPNGYPSTFLLVPLQGAVGQLFGAFVEFIALFAAIYLLIAFGAERLAARFGAGPLARLSLAALALFNPWTYTQLIAGHTFMLFSYGATFWIATEATRERPSSFRLALFAPLAAPQIQFLVIDAVVYGWLGIRHRLARALGVMGCMVLPIAIGVPLSRSSLLGTPVTIAWERGLSLAPLDALQLRGYFTHYDALLGPIVAWTMPVFALCALAGAVAGFAARRRGAAFLATFTLVPLVWSFGANGPLAGVFAWTVEHAPVTALFRELYDLIGFVAIGYVGFAAVFAARVRPASIVLFVVAACTAYGWVVAPPARWWVYRERIPTPAIANAPHTRFALMPATAPLCFGDVGSGNDPEIASQPNDVQPVNVLFPHYPIDAALARYARTGDTRSLAALSVTNVVARPWLHTDPNVAFQFAFPHEARFAERRPSASIADALPEMTLSALPSIGTLDASLGAGNVYFADAARATGRGVPSAWRSLGDSVAVAAPPERVAAAQGWVDARFAFTQRPELAQAIGGALTTNASATLPLRQARAALVWVAGTLRDAGGRTLAETTRGYRWISLPAGVASVRCAGTCVVAATGAPPAAPLEPPPHPAAALAFTAPWPWLALATLPPGPARLLRYNVAYDDHWAAVAARGSLAHLRIDQTVNGWLVPARDSATPVAIVQVAALAISFAEALAAIGTIALLLARTGSRGDSRVSPNARPFTAGSLPEERA